jgi:hypothetical protein
LIQLFKHALGVFREEQQWQDFRGGQVGSGKGNLVAKTAVKQISYIDVTMLEDADM